MDRMQIATDTSRTARFLANERARVAMNERRFSVVVRQPDNPGMFLAAFSLTKAADLYRGARLAAAKGSRIAVEEFGRPMYWITPPQVEALASDDETARLAAFTEIQARVRRT